MKEGRRGQSEEGERLEGRDDGTADRGKGEGVSDEA
jgi:hypothetical protein